MAKEKSKVLRGHGNISISNVDSENSECVTLTYSIKNIKTPTAASNLKAELDKLHQEESAAELLIEGFETDEETVSMKYKIKACEDEELARKIKKVLDQHLKKKGGQTTIDEAFIEDQEENKGKK